MPVFRAGKFIPQILTITLLFFFLTVPAQQRKYDSLTSNWNNVRLHDTVRLESLDELIWSFFINVDADSALYYSGKEYEYAQKHKVPLYEAYALNNLGLAANQKGDYSRSIAYHRQCLALRKSMNDKRGLAVSMNNIGKCFYDLGRPDSAITYYFSALRIREKIDDKSGLATSLSNIGAVYQIKGDPQQAMFYHKRALKIYEELGRKSGQARVLANLALLYKDLGDTNTAVSCMEKSLRLYETTGDLIGISNALHGLGNLYADISNLDAADTCQQRCLKIRLTIKDSSHLAKTYHSLATIAEQRGNRKLAFHYAEIAMTIAEIMNVPSEIARIGNYLYLLYAGDGNYKAALTTLEKVRAAEVLQNKQSLNQKIFEEQLKYDYDKKELASKADADRKVLIAETETENAKNKRNTWIILLSGLLIIVAVVAVFLVRTSRQKKIIAEQKSNLHKQKLLISQINPHFIFNSLNAIQNFIFSQDSMRAGTYLARFAGLMRMILNFSRENYITLAQEKEFLTEYLELQQLRFRDKFSYTIELDEETDLNNTLIPPMLAQPFVENAIEHGIAGKTEGGIISIRIKEDTGRLFYEIEDNGIGLTASAAKKPAQSKHRSLATVITRERLEVISPEEKISILDKSEIHPGDSGVLVRFAVPFREKQVTV